MDRVTEGVDVAVGAVGSEGEQRLSALSTTHDDRPVAPLAPGQRWSRHTRRPYRHSDRRGSPQFRCAASRRRSGGSLH